MKFASHYYLRIPINMIIMVQIKVKKVIRGKKVKKKQKFYRYALTVGTDIRVKKRKKGEFSSKVRYSFTCKTQFRIHQTAFIRTPVYHERFAVFKGYTKVTESAF